MRALLDHDDIETGFGEHAGGHGAGSARADHHDVRDVPSVADDVGDLLDSVGGGGQDASWIQAGAGASVWSIPTCRRTAGDPPYPSAASILNRVGISRTT